MLAETAHRDSQKRKGRAPDGDQAFKAGAGGWQSGRKRNAEPEIGETRPLF